MMTAQQLKEAEERSYFYRAVEDEKLWQNLKGLQLLTPGEPYHCGPHNVRAFRYAIRAASEATFEEIIKPLVFEIGTNLSYSATVMLLLGAERVHSIDIRDTTNMRLSAEAAAAKHPGRFTWQFGTTVATCKAPPFKPTLAFIDGGHEYKDVLADVLYCRQLGITRFLFDDWPPFYGPGVQPVVREQGLLPVAIIGSMAYCIVPESEGYFRTI